MHKRLPEHCKSTIYIFRNILTVESWNIYERPEISDDSGPEKDYNISESKLEGERFDLCFI